MSRIPTVRLYILYGAVILIAAVLLTRLAVLQIAQGNDFRERAERQYVAPVSQIFERGQIFFQDKDKEPFSAATLKSGFTVVINPAVLTKPKEVLAYLSPLLPELDRTSFLFKASKRDDSYEEIAWRINKTKAEEITELGIPGVQLFRQKWRFYPGASRAAHVIGFVGYEKDEQRGQYGLERYYNDILARDENRLYVNFFADAFSNIKQSLFYKARQGGDLVTNIDLEIERILEEELRDVSERFDVESAGAVVVDPSSGAIQALAVYPTFNLNNFQEEGDYQVFQNPIVENVFEFGSIMKPLTLAAAFDSGSLTPESTYYDNGFVIIDGERIENYDGDGRGKVSMQDVLNQSLNTGAVFAMRKMGKEKFADSVRLFGFGKETGVDLPNETRGLISNLESPRTIEYATASFGQGIATTPIAMVRALSVLANGGFLVTPHVVDRVEYTLGLSREISYGDEQRVLKPEMVEDITRMLVEVVDTALLGGTVAMERYSIAAKTGTAQLTRPDGKGYYSDRFLHSFFGYFPAYDPEFLVFFYLLDPRDARFASQTLTEPFMDVTQFLINYREIAPDR